MRFDPGSFRDPTSRILHTDDTVLRVLDRQGLRSFEAFSDTKTFRDWTTSGRLVPTRLLDEPDLQDIPGDWSAVLEHERVPLVTYPYEWPFDMLKDAALLQLDLAADALSDGFLTKDATPYNVQFVGASPMHIDLGSFDEYEDGQPWFGFDQFREHFLHPLILASYRGVPHQPLLRGSVRGVTATTCAGMLRPTERLRPSILLLITLPARAQRRRRAADRDVRDELRAAGFGPRVIEGQLQRLRRVVEGLDWSSPGSTWTEYSDRTHYGDDDLKRKTRFVEDAVRAEPRRRVLDLGANDGYFSRHVSQWSEYVVAVDRDPVVINDLYRSLKRSDEESVLPLVIDITDPSGGIGWRNRERPSFLDRVRPDLVLCLALIHHLVITDSVPLEEVVGLLASFGSDVVLELPTERDEMVRLLTSQKKDPDEDSHRYSVRHFERCAGESFHIAERDQVGERNLYLLRPRRG